MLQNELANASPIIRIAYIRFIGLDHDNLTLLGKNPIRVFCWRKIGAVL
jgi:hypothetical protein